MVGKPLLIVQRERCYYVEAELRNFAKPSVMHTQQTVMTFEAVHWALILHCNAHSKLSLLLSRGTSLTLAVDIKQVTVLLAPWETLVTLAHVRVVRAAVLVVLEVVDEGVHVEWDAYQQSAPDCTLQPHLTLLCENLRLLHKCNHMLY